MTIHLFQMVEIIQSQKLPLKQFVLFVVGQEDVQIAQDGAKRIIVMAQDMNVIYVVVVEYANIVVDGDIYVKGIKN